MGVLLNDKQKVAVFFTAFNEEKIISELVSKVNKKYDTFIVDDGSVDKTASIGSECGARILKHVVNIGQGNTVLTMFAFLVKSDYDFAVVLDADGQHNPADAELFVNELINSDYDVIQGSRILGKDYKDAPLPRRIFLRPLTSILNKLTGFTLTDSMCGFRGYRISTLKTVAKIFETFKEPEYMVSELWLKFSRNGFKIKEVPIVMSSRKHGFSYKGLFRYGFGVLSTIIRSMLELSKDK